MIFMVSLRLNDGWVGAGTRPQWLESRIIITTDSTPLHWKCIIGRNAPIIVAPCLFYCAPLPANAPQFCKTHNEPLPRSPLRLHSWVTLSFGILWQDPLGFCVTILGYFLTRSLKMIPTKCAPDCCHGREASDSGRETEQTSDLSSTVRSHNPASGKLGRRGRPGHNTARTRPFVRIFWTDGQVDAAGSADNGPHRQMDNSGPRPFWMIFG